jgi:hypothetical protein
MSTLVLADSASVHPARLVLLINIILISAIIIITPHRIALFFERVATRLRTLGKGGSGGMVILFLCVGALRLPAASCVKSITNDAFRDSPRESPTVIWIRWIDDAHRVYLWSMARYVGG